MTLASIYQLYTKNYLVDTDSRKIRKGALFFALKGANFNGNEFAEKAIELGASFAIVDEEAYAKYDKCILVDNVLETLQKLANLHRNQLDFPFIGLTGSNGKTTTKELIHAVLKTQFKTAATKGNYNNHIGVPLTLLSIKPDTEMAVIEMGANHQKEIAFLSSICEPDFGYITNFGKAHLEGFGGVEGVIKGKSELYDFLRANGKIAFVNPEDPIQVEKTKDITSIPFYKKIQLVSDEPFVKLELDQEEIQSNLVGAYNYNNMAIAATIGKHFGISNDNIKKAIENYVPDNNRSEIIEKGTNSIILDAYNANPSSMEVALKSFAKSGNQTKTVILGDMFELGEDSTKEHQAMVDLTESLCIDNQYFVGEHFHQTNVTNGIKFLNFSEFKSFVESNPIENSSILIKGSRGMQLERSLELLS
ncbi:MAG: UDP-N-acetylmuramoyl-tripeptide--D-alanyl-D-alanine ligase [Flavobacteriaceae bacterium]|nr:UDP-N-acetylmuramoyl-tripeptide--D-alanyl-D-alanine ligase [Flavobacteriaceae bacterium]|tara:strand:+ start:118263 stop:119522 length:1260 start_codon:yes stop_codon:yes gene_type:complete